MRKALIAGILAASILIAGGAAPALAQATDQNVPSYARPAAPSSEETVRGRIESIPGKYQIEVRDDRGFIDNVSLHQGTIINPTGITLAPGMSVTIYGTPSGNEFIANEIDTPYNETYPYLYPYPYPYYPYYPYYPWGVNFRFGWR